jgi:ADP-ribose pyrophosphatase
MAAEPKPSRQVVYHGKKVDLALQTVKLTDGTMAQREVVIHRGAVALLAMVDADHVCLVKNDRYAVGKTLIEVPAGTLNPGEQPDACAARELREETGYVAGRIVRVGEWWVSPGVLTERMYFYYCERLRAGTPSPELDEKIEPVIVQWDEAVRMIHDGRIEDAKSMLAILIGDRFRRGLS